MRDCGKIGQTLNQALTNTGLIRERTSIVSKNPGEWFSDKKPSGSDAIEAYALAYAEFQENEKGSISQENWPIRCF
jgi:hypothetical protein